MIKVIAVKDKHTPDIWITCDQPAVGMSFSRCSSFYVLTQMLGLRNCAPGKINIQYRLIH
jgi:hypothetical protein